MTTAAQRARWYLETIVKATVAECVADQLDVRRAFLAAIVVSHLADYIAQVPPRDKIKKLVQSCDFLAVARIVSDAAKQGTLTRNNIIIEPPNVDAVQNDVIESWGLGHGSGPHGTLPESDGKYRLSNFNRGRSIMRLCSYAASDFGAHDNCEMRLLWGGVQSLPFSLFDGSDFQVFVDYYAISSIFTPAVVFGIDRRVLQSFKGSVLAHCNFYHVDCGPLVQWHQENMNQNKNVKVNID